jgi:PhnB protein
MKQWREALLVKLTQLLQEMFWAQRFGLFTDKFGTPWMVNCEKRA